MRTQFSVRAKHQETQRRRVVNFRALAEHHALGPEPRDQAKKRILDLAILEAEALACQTGVPELVLLTLAEEKIQTARHWFNRQQELKTRSFPWPIAA